MSRLPLTDDDVDYTTVAQLVEPPQVPVPPHRAHEPANNQKRSDPFQFGSRFLEEGDDVFEYNAWDHVEPDPEYREFVQHQYEKQRAAPVSDFDRHRFNADPVKWWNLFYKNNTSKFFKDRKWLQQEFPVLADVTKEDAGPKVVLEVGAGAGNTAFPIIANNNNPHLRVHACDFSKKAVEIMRNSEFYDDRFMVADIWDVAGEGDGSLPPGLEEGSVDVVVMIFIFSGLAPDQWERAVSNTYRVLKSGGVVLFRDYGRGDLAQARFKKGRLLSENFYVRGDGTRVYFFEKDELAHIWGSWSPETGLPSFDGSAGDDATESHGPRQGDLRDGFEVLNLAPDHRLNVNRQKKLKMYRCWMQGVFQKQTRPSDAVAAATNQSKKADELMN